MSAFTDRARLVRGRAALALRAAWALHAGVCAALALAAAQAFAQPAPRVVDIPTRPGITERALVLAPESPKAAVVLLAGGHGGLQIVDNGAMRWGEGNFLVRTRQRFAEEQLFTVVLDAPSDRRSPPFLGGGFRGSADHVEDLKAVIAWVRKTSGLPVWLVGTSRGTQSAAWVATQLSREDGPDGLVLTSTILSDPRSRPVTEMPLKRLAVPVLVVHHEDDGCRLCAFSDMPTLMDRLAHLPRRQLLTFKGGDNQGDPCEARAYHGFAGIEGQVVPQIAAWITAK